MGGLHGVADPMGLGGRMGLGRRRGLRGMRRETRRGLATSLGGWGAKMQGRGTDSHGSSISSGSSQRQTGVVRQPGSITHCPVLLPRYTAACSAVSAGPSVRVSFWGGVCAPVAG